MQLLGKSAFEHLIQGGELLREDAHGPKVYRIPGDRIVKLFRIKHWFSLSVIYPYSVRFRRNALRLKRRGIRCVETRDIFYCHAIRRHGIIYNVLQGKALDAVFTENKEQARGVFLRWAAFIAELHHRRVYFRSLHPGNILLLPDGGFGLIDVADVRFPLFPLGIERRRRNFRHLFRSYEFCVATELFSAAEFIQAYLGATALSETDKKKLGRQLSAALQRH